MKTLLILRHAKSSWGHSNLDDHDRPLNARGQRDAPRMGQLLQTEGLVPELLLSSTAERARTTAQQVAEGCGYPSDKIVLTADLYHPLPDDCLAVLRQHGEPHQRVLLVAHNPGLEELVEQLTGEAHRLPTAALVQIALPIETWQDLRPTTRGTLINLWRPKEL